MPLKKQTSIAIYVCILTLTGCSLPMNKSVKDTISSEHAEHWLQGTLSAPQLKQDLTAYLPLDDAFMSIASRIHLIRNAKYSLDLQYYIWKDDSIGHMMLAELLNAADRGVKVRLMIDDQNGTQLDEALKALSAHPNFEIKLFNPYKYRNFRVIDYAFRLKNINHRMHNKLIIADGVIAVTGGRNISREYFDASDSFQFTDLDILFLGESVKNANDVFIEFWNDNLSYSTKQLLGESSEQELKKLRNKYLANAQEKDVIENRLEFAQQQIQENLKQRPIQWAKAHFVADSPNKIRGEAQGQQYIYNQMIDIMGKPKAHLELVSAYFVPTAKGEQYLSELARNNIDVRILTNSFLANDVALVHAFYAKYRHNLLKNGVKLYEFKPYIEREKRTWYEAMTGNVIPAKGKNASSLHAKFFDIDGMVFIGSFNFDPRSAFLNTEVGLVIESDQLQDQISTSLDQYLPQIAYQLKLNPKGEIIWQDQKSDGSMVEHTHDPETTRFQRFTIKIVSYLPIEWMM
ncbi:MAG: phospholipase D family protein [Candidatus Acinetobacter avistercoris]|uniref:phospholipase D family protein n=1 Tax=Acinetobacter sp. KS-LM10 TaxID=3120518 RepID=UPI001F929CCB|nr:phospholipase D family protein [Candidatus Acinetobacter avistercoris]